MSRDFYGKRYKAYMGIAAAIVIIMAFFALVFPGFTKGIDLSGGTLFIAKTAKPIDAKLLSDRLSEKFNLVDLGVSSISSPTGYGATIRFASNKDLTNASAEIDAAKSLLKADPAANESSALSRAGNALKILEKFVPRQSQPSNASEAIAQAESAFTAAKEKINAEIQQTIIEEFDLGKDTAFQIKEVSPTLGASFWQTAVNVIIIVLILIVIVVFFFFREIIPSIVVISCGLFDAVFCLGAMSLVGIPLSLNTIPALLMLMGYSIDTDVMVASRILRRKESNPTKMASESMLTGFTMTGTTIAAITVMVILSYIYQVGVIFEIGSVLLLGLVGDLLGTWLWSASLLIWYAKRKQKKLDERLRS